MADLDGYLGFGMYQVGERTVNYFSANVDRLIIGRFLGASALGYYSLAYQLITFPLMRLNPAVTQVALPTLSKLQHDSALLRRGYLKVVSFIATVSFPILAGIFLVAPQFVELVYGKTWLPAVAVIRILCAVGALKALGNPIGSLLLSRGRADIGFYWNVLGLVAMSSANYIGVRWGIEGAAYGTLVVAAFILFPAEFYLRWVVVGMRARPYLSSLKSPLIATAGMMGLVWIASPLWKAAPPLASLVCFVCAGVLLYVVAMWSLDRQLCVEIRQAVLTR
jgi:O-antigen/teichoic acid export membrane protein